jgi:peptide/nickel transport system substrate-binding protein
MKHSLKSLRYGSAAALLLSGLVLLGGCGKKSSNLSARNQVTWWVLSDIERLNPLIAQETTGQYVENEMWEALNTANAFTQELAPSMASLPEVSADHLTYTYTMNPKAHWSDGTPLTGEDVIFSYKTVMNSRITDLIPLQNYFFTLDSAYYPNGDRSKVAFHLSKPYFQEDIILGGGYVKIIPKHIWDPGNLSDKIAWSDIKNPNSTNPFLDTLGRFFSDPAHDRDPKFQIASGAYMFADWKTNDHITLKRDPNYWGWDIRWNEAYPDTIILKTISDQNAALASLKTKEIDIMPQLTAQQYLNEVDLKKFSYLKKDTAYFNVYTFLAYNNDKPMFSSVKTRQALTKLIDRDQMLHSILKDIAKKDDGPVAPTQPNFDPSIKQPGFNPDDAKKLLAEDGWTDSDGDGILDKTLNGKKTPFKFTMLVRSGDIVGSQVLLVISENLRKAGIDAQITQIESSVFQQRLRSHLYDAAISAWGGNATEDEIYQLWHSSQTIINGSNFYCFRNPDADKLMENIRVEFDKTKRYQMSNELTKIIVGQQPVTFLFCSPSRIAWVDRFDNVAFFHQRPNFDPRYFVVRGRDIKRSPNAVAMGTN